MQALWDTPPHLRQADPAREAALAEALTAVVKEISDRIKFVARLVKVRARADHHCHELYKQLCVEDRAQTAPPRQATRKQATPPAHTCDFLSTRSQSTHLQCWYKNSLQRYIPYVPSVLLETVVLAAAQRKGLLSPGKQE